MTRPWKVQSAFGHPVHSLGNIEMKVVQSKKSPEMARHTKISLLEEGFCLIADAEFLRTRSHHSELFGAGRRQEDRGVDGEEYHQELEKET